MEEDKTNLPIAPDRKWILDITGLGQIGQLLIEKASLAIGTLYKPRAIRKEAEAQADADAYSIIRKAQAEAYANMVESTTKNLVERAGHRIRYREIQRQINLENTLEEALKLLESAPPAEEPREVQDDWMSKYMDYVQDISDEKIRSIWAQILTNQFRSHKRSVSLLTLDGLRLMEREHALSFDKFYRLCQTYGKYTISGVEIEHNFLSRTDMEALEALGFAKREDIAPWSIAIRKAYTITLEFPDTKNVEIESVPVYRLTFQGKELASVIFDLEVDNAEINQDAQYRYLSVDSQATLIKAWASSLANLEGALVRVKVNIGSLTAKRKQEITNTPSTYTHEWKSELDGWIPLDDAKLVTTPAEIRILSV